jgi:hypothetical protein
MAAATRAALLERVRTSAYLNNVVEQDQRAIKRRCTSMPGCKSFATAAVRIAGPVIVAGPTGARAPLLGSIAYVDTDESVSLTTKGNRPL